MGSPKHRPEITPAGVRDTILRAVGDQFVWTWLVDAVARDVACGLLSRSELSRKLAVIEARRNAGRIISPARYFHSCAMELYSMAGLAVPDKPGDQLLDQRLA